MGLYSVALGYKLLKAILIALVGPALWNGIWNIKSLPKIDIFIWTLEHQSILTSENMRKKDSQAPRYVSFISIKKKMLITFS